MPEEQAPAQEPKKGGMMTIFLIAGIMAIEAVAVYMLVTFTMGSATTAAEMGIEGRELDEAERPVEIPLIQDRFMNLTTGRVWGWNIEVVLQVRQKNEERVRAELERRQAEVRDGVAKLIRSAQDRHLKEPNLQTITRQLTAYLNEIFGADAAGTPRIERVLIPDLTGTPLDG